MLELLNDPAVWASFVTLTILEIVLGVDNVIFISIAASRLPEHHRARARMIGLSGALVLRIVLLFSIAWIITLSEPFTEIMGQGVSWRDVILFLGGLFLIYKAATEIFEEVEGQQAERAGRKAAEAAFAAVIVQIMLLDMIFSIDSVITAVGIADHVEVMIAAVSVAIVVMMIFANPIAAFIEAHPSTKMLALAFLVMVGMALVADGFHFHVERSFIYAAMIFGGAVEGLNLLRQKRRRAGA
ncbi:TerC family protein [Roseovarius sp. TE539]|uniref:TerC family protein n=1 Tax=Roseovarius sp. TE539 TaxID=2249812 RepID=UPI000DDDD75D|nr:TerC family protein [Roseovarius sp. TE539]RBI77125.1 TerC family protein [Roseovarius sp. TE539]